jgi:hypothetical protein
MSSANDVFSLSHGNLWHDLKTKISMNTHHCWRRGRTQVYHTQLGCCMKTDWLRLDTFMVEISGVRRRHTSLSRPKRGSRFAGATWPICGSKPGRTCANHAALITHTVVLEVSGRPCMILDLCRTEVGRDNRRDVVVVIVADLNNKAIMVHHVDGGHQADDIVINSNKRGRGG